MRPRGRRVRWGSLGSLGWALVVIGFVRGRWVHCAAPFGVVCFVLGNWVRWGESLGSFGDARFFGVRPGCRGVRSGSMGSLGCALLVAFFFQGRWVHWVAHLGSSGSFGVAGFIGVRPGGRRVRSGTLDSLS